MIRRIRGTSVVVTGATSGIGRETALEFAQAGANVVIAGRRENRLRELALEVMALDAQAINFANKLAPSLIDLTLGWTVPLIEAMRRAAPANRNRGNLYEPANKEQDQ